MVIAVLNAVIIFPIPESALNVKSFLSSVIPASMTELNTDLSAVNATLNIDFISEPILAKNVTIVSIPLANFLYKEGDSRLRKNLILLTVAITIPPRAAIATAIPDNKPPNPLLSVFSGLSSSSLSFSKPIFFAICSKRELVLSSRLMFSDFSSLVKLVPIPPLAIISDSFSILDNVSNCST